MSDFVFGLIIGVLIVTVVLTPFTVYFGLVYFRLRKLEKIAAEHAKKEYIPKVNDDTKKTIEEAEKLISKVKVDNGIPSQS